MLIQAQNYREEQLFSAIRPEQSSWKHIVLVQVPERKEHQSNRQHLQSEFDTKQR